MKKGAHLAAVGLLAIAIGALFLREPGFGDDLTYWGFAFDLHERGLAAWSALSFHQLRWPVWGLCWLGQAVAGPGLFSYYGVPLFYLAGGALLSFSLGKRLLGNTGWAWGCALAYLFHPLLDTLLHRPMPDLAEGVLGAGAILAWWELMLASTRQRAWFFAGLTGLCVFVLEANRVTGVFIVPVLIIGTLAFFRGRFAWLLAAGAIAAVLYAAQSFLYQQLFGNWLHDLTANLGNRGAKGTDFPHPWLLPFRFLDAIWTGTAAGALYSIFALAGCWIAWRRLGTLGRVLVVWSAVLYLEYACTPQSLFPLRLLVRDAERFLACLAIPLAVLAVAGAWAAKTRLAVLRRRPLVSGALVAAFLLVITDRPFFDLGFVPEFRRYMDSLPPGTVVFTHRSMRHLAYLAGGENAGRLRWLAHTRILHAEPAAEADAAHADEFWYARKLAWLHARKDLETDPAQTRPPLASYFAAPEKTWRLMQVLRKDDTPDLVFYRRRTDETPAPEIFQAGAPEWRELIPSLPARWEAQSGARRHKRQWSVPERFRGRLARIDFHIASPEVEALTARLTFKSAAGVSAPPLVLKPYSSATGGTDFFAFAIPRESSTCEIELKFSRKTERVEFSRFRAVLESP